MKKDYKPNFHQYYLDHVVVKFLGEYGYKNTMSVPKITKITLNMGLGDTARDKSKLEKALRDLGAVAGQKPIICNARRSVASFKIRTGMPIGCKVTLRSNKMYEFFEKLVNISIPRFRDFRGLSKRSFDQDGNYNMGVKDQFVFPEIDFEKNDSSQGLDISFTTTAKNKDEAVKLFECFNFPFKE